MADASLPKLPYISYNQKLVGVKKLLKDDLGFRAEYNLEKG
jgi:hypothetical protein